MSKGLEVELRKKDLGANSKANDAIKFLLLYLIWIADLTNGRAEVEVETLAQLRPGHTALFVPSKRFHHHPINVR